MQVIQLLDSKKGVDKEYWTAGYKYWRSSRRLDLLDKNSSGDIEDWISRMQVIQSTGLPGMKSARDTEYWTAGYQQCR